MILTVIQKVFTGPVPEKWATFPDLHGGERASMAPVIGLMLLVGVVPQLIVNSVNPTVVNLLAHWRFKRAASRALRVSGVLQRGFLLGSKATE